MPIIFNQGLGNVFNFRTNQANTQKNTKSPISMNNAGLQAINQAVAMNPKAGEPLAFNQGNSGITAQQGFKGKNMFNLGNQALNQALVMFAAPNSPTIVITPIPTTPIPTTPIPTTPIPTTPIPTTPIPTPAPLSLVDCIEFNDPVDPNDDIFWYYKIAADGSNQFAFLPNDPLTFDATKAKSDQGYFFFVGAYDKTLSGGVPKGVTDAKDKYTYAEYLSLLPSNLGSGEDA